MYAKMNLTGDGIVDSQCEPQTTYSIDKVIAGNLSLYSGCCPLPDIAGNLYNLSSDYITMADKPSSTQYLNRLGLTPMPDYKVKKTYGNRDGYFYPNDGRIVDIPRGIKTVLDAPASVGSVDMDLVSSFDNRNYGAVYQTYSDINNGQIAYYIDPSQSQPFEYPNYSISSNVDKIIRKDPMDSVKPEYIKKPITSTLYNMSNDQQTRDALFFREDIMSRQQNRYNRESWLNRWVKPDHSDTDYQAPSSSCKNTRTVGK